jgi:antitoxin component of MazEF toxin-antitoxin module
MNTAEIMEDGDLRLPPDVAAKLNVKPGDSLGVEVDTDGTVRLYPKKLAIDDVCGMLHPPSGVHYTVEQMDEAVADAFRRGDL